MTSFTRTWNLAYEALPEDDDDALEGALRIRNFKEDTRERLAVDHSWAGDTDDGKHKQVTFIPQASNPTLDADNLALFAKAVSGKTQLFFKDEDGNVAQLTTGGQLNTQLTGAIVAYAAAVPTGWLECNGQAVSRATYAALYAVIGTTFGSGDGSTTFNLPDLTGRTIFGKESSQSRITSGVSGLNGSTLGAAGGDQHAQAHAHSASASDSGHAHQLSGGNTVRYLIANQPGGGNYGSGGATTADVTHTESAQASISVTVNSNLSGGAQNIPPAMILRWIIKT